MPHVLPLLALSLALSSPELEPAHASNSIYQKLVTDGIDLGGTLIRFPHPRLRDGQSKELQREGLKEFVGGGRALDDLLRDSVTAPFVLKVRDETTKDGSRIRVADLVFAVHADLAAIDPAGTARESLGKSTEVANMRVETTPLDADVLKSLKIPPPDTDHEWYAHITARLLDRIRVEATDHVLVTGTKDSLVVAARTDPRFNSHEPLRNGWTLLGRDGKPAGAAVPYVGGASYSKISRLAGSPGTLVVEAHFAFVEPRPWFDNAPILRSKFSPIAQDQIRRLRREIKARAQ